MSTTAPYVKQSLTADGNATGYVTVASVTDFFVGGFVYLVSGAVTAKLLQIDLIDGLNIYLKDPLIPGNYARFNCSAYLFADSAYIIQNVQGDYTPVDSSSSSSSGSAFSTTITSSVASGADALEIPEGARISLNGATATARIEHNGDFFITNTNGNDVIFRSADGTENARVKHGGAGLSGPNFVATTGGNNVALQINSQAFLAFNGSTATHYLFEDSSASRGSGTISFVGLPPGSVSQQLTSILDFGNTAPTYNGALIGGLYKMTVGFGYWGHAASATSDITIGVLPAKGRIKAVYADVTQAFAGTGLTGTITFQLGTSVGGSDLLLAADVKTAPVTLGLLGTDLGTTLKAVTNSQVGSAAFWTSKTISARLSLGAGTIGNGTTTNITAGSIDLYIITENFA